MSIYEHINGLSSTIEFKCNRNKQDKCLNSHHFPLFLPQKTKHHSGDSCYSVSKWCSIKFQWVFGVQLIGWGEGGSTNLWVMLNLPCQGFKNTFTKIEAHAGMAERLVRYFAIEDALRIEIKETL